MNTVKEAAILVMALLGSVVAALLLNADPLFVLGLSLIGMMIGAVIERRR